MEFNNHFHHTLIKHLEEKGLIFNLEIKQNGICTFQSKRFEELQGADFFISTYLTGSVMYAQKDKYEWAYLVFENEPLGVKVKWNLTDLYEEDANDMDWLKEKTEFFLKGVSDFMNVQIEANP